MNTLKKWIKFTGKSIVEELTDLGVEFKDVKVEYDNVYTICTLTKRNERGIGVAICSYWDRFDFKEGVPKSIGRAICALKKKENSHEVRWADLLPESWSIGQVKRLENAPYLYKSVYYVDIEVPAEYKMEWA